MVIVTGNLNQRFLTFLPVHTAEGYENRVELKYPEIVPSLQTDLCYSCYNIPLLMGMPFDEYVRNL